MLHADSAIDPVRWLMYLLLGAPLLTWFFTRQEGFRLLGLLVALIIVQDNIAGRRWVWAFSVAPSFILTYVALLSQMFQRRLPRPGVFGPLWISLLFCAAIGGIAGSIGTGLLANNIDRYQIVFLEGILFFLFGLVAVRKRLGPRVLPSRAGDLGGPRGGPDPFLHDRHRLPLPERDQ